MWVLLWVLVHLLPLQRELLQPLLLHLPGDAACLVWPVRQKMILMMTA